MEHLARAPAPMARCASDQDLAGLAASFPGTVPPVCGLRFLCAYLGDRAGDPRLRRRLFRAVRTKAQRIRNHVPRYG